MQKKLIAIKELSEYVGLLVSTIYNWVSQRKIPFVKCGRCLRFDIKKIDQWIEKGAVEEKQF